MRRNFPLAVVLFLLSACEPGGRRGDQAPCVCQGPLEEGGESVHFECGEQFCHEDVLYECGDDGHAQRIADACEAPDCEADPQGDGCPCSAGPIECWTGAAETEPTAGACRTGRRECVEGRLGPCVGQVLPTAELCDDIDNDCDGTVDDGVRDAEGRCEESGTCEERSRWIYVVTDQDELVRFEPDSLELVPVGPVRCDDAPFGAHPFSMAVDRSGYAWVLFVQADVSAPGAIFRVSVADGSCSPTDYQPGQDDFDRFGMGFVSDAPGSESESLYVAGGIDLVSNQRLGRIQMGDLHLDPVGDLPGSPELTGNADAELWAFFPDLSPATVSRLDPTSAAITRTYELTDVDSSNPTAWAFAFWGGRFYIFLATAGDDSSNVFRLSPDSGDVVEVIEDTGYQIVGAGVSTCAPVDLI